MHSTTKMISSSLFESGALHQKILESESAIQAKIQLIKEEIISGNYQINAEHIAAQLMTKTMDTTSNTEHHSNNTTAACDK